MLRHSIHPEHSNAIQSTKHEHSRLLYKALKNFPRTTEASESLPLTGSPKISTECATRHSSHPSSRELNSLASAASHTLDNCCLGVPAPYQRGTPRDSLNIYLHRLNAEAERLLLSDRPRCSS
jgi:hypothetical protein